MQSPLSKTVTIENILEEAGIRPTPNRILVWRALSEAASPQSLIELETYLDTLDRSSILRVLTLFSQHRLLHIMEDGRGITKYEICHSHNHSDHSDLHPHFYCQSCHRVICFDNLRIPAISIPEEYKVLSANFMLKGICPDCSK